MTTIYKYHLEDTVTYIDLPVDAKVLKFGNQKEKPVIWVLINTDNPTQTREFRMYGTGVEIDFDKYNNPNMLLNHIGTEQFENGGLVFVFHLFEVIL